ncbi:hypothetical protein BDZ90DRAFT_136841 [Jaminaea rosea]|uniref:Uncharacterized protein n=1 Tax=Jaminaea rosea TaxID=1569628 RepID=A0A316UUM3_9BASI|nr:hypothetical protein BDZ90DRAFT_136841 [Jaminaea rosea]PWN29010.1 hypothetical protein BDZ90DRAFT_136841 [Jaminaea rosea]
MKAGRSPSCPWPAPRLLEITCSSSYQSSVTLIKNSYSRTDFSLSCCQAICTRSRFYLSLSQHRPTRPTHGLRKSSADGHRLHFTPNRLLLLPRAASWAALRTTAFCVLSQPIDPLTIILRQGRSTETKKRRSRRIGKALTSNTRPSGGQ